MKQIIKCTVMAFAAALALTACVPKEFDDYSLESSSYTVTESQFTFDMTPGSDEWTYNFIVTFSADLDAVKNPFTFEVSFGDGGVVKDLQGSHEYIVYAGTYTAQCLVYTPNGDVKIKEKTITIAHDNDKLFTDDPASLQFALTGGKANSEGKAWFLGDWTAMRNPDNRDDVWWDFKDPAIMDDAFIFKPNSVNPNGAFTHVNNGDSFMNEALGNLYPDGDPAGSFITVNYTPPADATWEINQIDGKTILTIYKGFFGYASSPDDLVKTDYEVISFSASSIRMILASGWDGWCYELVSDAPVDPLTGEGSKTWVVDSNNKHLQEVKEGLPDIAGKLQGHLGLGAINGGYQEWWGAVPGDKSEDSEVGWTLYDCKYTFSSDKTLTIVTRGEGYGRKACADKGGFTPHDFQGDDMLFPYNGGTYTYTKTGETLEISDNGYLVYYCGEQTYEILYLSQTALCVRVQNTTEGQDWVFILTPEGEQ